MSVYSNSDGLRNFQNDLTKGKERKCEKKEFVGGD